VNPHSSQQVPGLTILHNRKSVLNGGDHAGTVLAAMFHGSTIFLVIFHSSLHLMTLVQYFTTSTSKISADIMSNMN